ncbi:MAG: undecaprenyl-diphosphate phosphatase [Candidatus Riflebacteria bacterium]|nr:undecaprenyl-diphosphate phosphatase [Candidatus Riflebacteria bacterium]
MTVYIFAVIQGIVEGLTEFLPISSTGHMIITDYFLEASGFKSGLSEEAVKSFEVFIQLGAILAVAILYRAKIADMIGHWRDGLTYFGKGENSKEASSESGRLSLVHILFAMLPAVVIGLLCHSFIKHYLFSAKTVVIGLVVGGVYMIFAERRETPISAATLDAITHRQAFRIGLFQCLALWPGFSRAGATIAGGLLVGANHRTAADFSFILAVPMMIAATGLDLLKSYKALSVSLAGPFATGFFVSFVVAWLAVVAFLNFLERVKLTPFAWYRFVMAAVVLFFMFR